MKKWTLHKSCYICIHTRIWPIFSSANAHKGVLHKHGWLYWSVCACIYINLMYKWRCCPLTPVLSMGWKFGINLLLTFNTLCSTTLLSFIRIWLFTLNVQCRCNDTIVGSNLVVPCLPPDQDLPMQSYGISQWCGDFQATSLQSTHFEIAIIGSGLIFGIVEEFCNVAYLMSLVGRFRYKFKRNSSQHSMVICSVET